MGDGLLQSTLRVYLCFNTMIMRYLLVLTLLFSLACGDEGLKPPDNPGVDITVAVEPFNDIPSLEEMVVYQVNMRAISSIGTFKGVQGRLDNIEELGANVIWLMPIFPVGIEKGVNSPYAPKDYTTVGSEYGSMDDLIRLVNDAHSRGIAVILDWVANHTAWDHAWVSEHPDWYATDDNGNMIQPPGTNWTDVVELDFSNSDMKAEMISSMQFWIDNAGIDGFRCDAADFVPSSFWSQALGDLKKSTDKELILLAEGSQTANFSAGFEMDYAWDFNHAIRSAFESGLSATTIINAHTNEYNRIPSGKEKLRYITNHDVYAWESTVVDDFTAEGSVTAFVITAYLGGIPLIYNGQEIARPTNINFLTDDPIDWTLNPGIYDEYIAVMNARAALGAVSGGVMTSFSSSDVIAFTRTNGDEELLVLANIRNENKTIAISSTLEGDWTNALKNDSVSLSGSIDLAGFEYLILKR